MRKSGSQTVPDSGCAGKGRMMTQERRQRNSTESGCCGIRRHSKSVRLGGVLDLPGVGGGSWSSSSSSAASDGGAIWLAT